MCNSGLRISSLAGVFLLFLEHSTLDVMLTTDSVTNDGVLSSPNLWSENIEKALHYKVQYRKPLCMCQFSLVSVLQCI